MAFEITPSYQMVFEEVGVVLFFICDQWKYLGGVAFKKKTVESDACLGGGRLLGRGCMVGEQPPPAPTAQARSRQCSPYASQALRGELIWMKGS